MQDISIDDTTKLTGVYVEHVFAGIKEGFTNMNII